MTSKPAETSFPIVTPIIDPVKEQYQTVGLIVNVILVAGKAREACAVKQKAWIRLYFLPRRARTDLKKK